MGRIMWPLAHHTIAALLHTLFRKRNVYRTGLLSQPCACREEGNEPVKLEIAQCVGAWCSSADALPAEAQKQFERGLGEKGALLQAHLRSLVQVR